MAWVKNGTPLTLTGTADDMDITDLSGSIFNQFLIYKTVTGGAGQVEVTYNNDGTSSYAQRRSADGGTDTTNVSQTNMRLDLTGDKDGFIVGYVIGKSTEEKLGIYFMMTPNASGAGTTPSRFEIVNKWSDTSNTIDRIDSHNSGAGSYNTDSNISALGSDLTPGASIPFAANVQSGSRAEITDTRKMYHYVDPITFEDDFTSYADQAAADAVWVPNTTNIDVNVSTDVLDINNVGTLTSNISCVCDLGTISDTKWVLRYKVNWSTLSVGERWAQTFVGLSDKNGTVAWDGSQDSISVLYNRWGLFKQQNSVGASMQDNLLGSDMTDMSASTDYYVETIRDGTSVSYTVYSDSDYSVTVSGISGTVTLTGDPTGLRYFVIRNDTTSGTGTTAGIIDDVKLYSGVTTVPAGNVWKEEGT